MGHLEVAKEAMRADALARRRIAHAALGARAGEAVAAHFLTAVGLLPGAVVAGYWPLAEELDVRPLMARLGAAGHLLALPVMAGRRRPLLFRRWEPGAVLVEAAFDVMEPAPDVPQVIPDVLLVPLLAFDTAGHRLGYGAGYFDRTLAALRAQRAVLAVGIAYAAQRVPAVPHGPADEPLDWIVTEEGAIHARPPA